MYLYKKTKPRPVQRTHVLHRVVSCTPTTLSILFPLHLFTHSTLIECAVINIVVVVVIFNTFTAVQQGDMSARESTERGRECARKDTMHFYPDCALRVRHSSLALFLGLL